MVVMSTKKRGTVSAFFIEASPNAQVENNSPLPRLTVYQFPLPGSGYATSMNVLTASPSTYKNLAIFDKRISKNAFSINANYFASANLTIIILIPNQKFFLDRIVKNRVKINT